MNSNLHEQSVGEIIVSAAGMFSVLENLLKNLLRSKVSCKQKSWGDLRRRWLDKAKAAPLSLVA